MTADERLYMPRQPRWRLTGLVPIVVGIIWLLSGWNGGWFAGLVASIPGVVLTASGATLLLWPGERLVNCYLALCALASILLAVVMVWVLGFAFMLLLIAGGLACCLVAGFAAMRQTPIPAAVPAPPHDLMMAAKVALDEGFLAFFVLCSSVPRGAAVQRDRQDLATLAALTVEQDWLAAAQRLHLPPAVPQDVRVESRSASGASFDWLTFASDYAPPPGLPGGNAWLDQHANAQACARVFEHAGGPRPWLLCLHGYRMGTALADFSLFRVQHLHATLGFNLLMPILPLHGPRRQGRLSGSGFIDGSLLSMFHAETQALWDIRRSLAWLRATRADVEIGVLGYSLGSYNAALLAAVEPDLACVIAGIPLTSIAAVAWDNMPTMDRRYMQACGLSLAGIEAIMRPISPLYWAPRIAHDRRFIFAASCDQIVPPEQPLALSRHWDEPTMYWYQGSHISVRHESGAAEFVDQALARSFPGFAGY